MLYRLAADFVVILHIAFVAFVCLGGFLVLRWQWLIWLHVPAAVWGALIEFFGWICPLTPLENQLRQAAGDGGYAGGFVEHYLIPVLYPGALTRDLQLWLGAGVVAVNVVAYGLLAWRFRQRHRPVD